MKSFVPLAAGIAALLGAHWAGAETAPAKAPAQVDIGVALQAYTTFMNTGVRPLASNIVLIGGKFGRLNVAAGAELHLFPLTFAPRYVVDVRFAFLRSADTRTELFAAGSISYQPEGYYDPLHDPWSEPTYVPIRFRVGPGVRYWAHPRVAISLASGLVAESGTYKIFENSGGYSIASFFGQIGVMGVVF